MNDDNTRAAGEVVPSLTITVPSLYHHCACFVCHLRVVRYATRWPEWGYQPLDRSLNTCQSFNATVRDEIAYMGQGWCGDGAVMAQ